MTPQLLVNIDVDDLERAIAFYGAALGLRVNRRFGGAGAELVGAGAPIFVLAKAAGTPASATVPQKRDYARHWTPVHFDLVVDDVDAAVARAVAAGARAETGHVDWRGSRCVSLADPFGHGFCFIQFERDGTYTR